MTMPKHTTRRKINFRKSSPISDHLPLFWIRGSNGGPTAFYVTAHNLHPSDGWVLLSYRIYCILSNSAARLGGFLLFISVMCSALSNFQNTISHTVNQPVIVVDPPAPPAAPVAFQGLGLSDSMKRVALRVPDQLVDSLQYFNILGLP